MLRVGSHAGAQGIVVNVGIIFQDAWRRDIQRLSGIGGVVIDHCNGCIVDTDYRDGDGGCIR